SRVHLAAAAGSRSPRCPECRLARFAGLPVSMPAKTLHFPSPRHLNQLYAGLEEHLAMTEATLGVKLVSREDWLKIEGSAEAIEQTEALFGFLNQARAQGVAIRPP